MEVILELLFECFGELLLQVVGEALMEMGFHRFSRSPQKERNPWGLALGYATLGFIVGGLSLLVWPNNLVPPPWRLWNVLITPFLAGGIMVLMGLWRAKRGEPVLRINRFVFGYLFAFAFAVIRFVFAH